MSAKLSKIQLSMLDTDVQNKFSGYDSLFVQKTLVYNVKSPPYNAKGNGSTDDTSAIQTCINDCATGGDGYVYIPKGTYMINAITSLNIPSNIRIVFNSQAVLKAINTNATAYTILKLNGISNVVIEGNFANIVGDRDTNTQVTGEGGMCVRITDCTNIYIKNLIASKGFGDGFYVGTNINSFNENVYLVDCIADNNRRNGMSITSVKNMLVLGGEYKNTNGTNPQYGIDIEPNPNCLIQNVNLVGVSTSNNFNGGLQLCPMFVNGTNLYNVNVEGFTSDHDLGGGIDLIGGSPFPSSEIYGKINIKDSIIINPVSTGVYFQAWRNMPRADVSNVTVINPNNQNSANNQLSSGFVVYASPNDAAGNYGNIKFENCGVIDNRGTSQTYAPFYMASDATHNIQNVSIIDPYWEGIKPTLKGWIESTGNFFGNAKFTNPSIVNISSNQSIYAYLGQELVATTSLTATLSSSNGSLGNEYIVRYGAASGTVTLAAGSGDTIIYKGSSVASVALTVPGTFIKVRSIGYNKWIVVEQNIS